MYTARILPTQFGWDVGKKSEVNTVGYERSEGSKALCQGENDLKERVQSVLRVIKSKLSLQTLSVESNIPVCRVVNQIKQAWDDSI